MFASTEAAAAAAESADEEKRPEMKKVEERRTSGNGRGGGLSVPPKLTQTRASSSSEKAPAPTAKEEAPLAAPEERGMRDCRDEEAAAADGLGLMETDGGEKEKASSSAKRDASRELAALTLFSFPSIFVGLHRTDI